MSELRPTFFPEEYWQYVPDIDKPHVKDRYKGYTEERKAEIIILFKTQLYSRICDKRPNQRNYIFAQALVYPRAFFHADPEHPDRVLGFEMRCNTTSDKPVRSLRMQNFSPVQRRYLSVKTEELVVKGYCERSESSYRAPIMLVVKKTYLEDFMKEHGESFFEKLHDPAYAKEVGTFYRLTIDLRMLNAVTTLDGHPLPLQTDILNQMKGCIHFTAYDIKDAFWCVPVAQQDRHKFAFATHDELLQWCVVPQGSKCGANFFARVVSRVFRNAFPEIAYYQDDVYVFAHQFVKLYEA